VRYTSEGGKRILYCEEQLPTISIREWIELEKEISTCWVFRNCTWLFVRPKREQSDFLLCPYGGALHRILAYRWNISDLSGPLLEDVPDLLNYTYQSQDCGIPKPLDKLLWACPPVIFVTGPQVWRQEPWNMNHSRAISHLLPDILPGCPSIL
jgi:hypothetical protein